MTQTVSRNCGADDSVKFASNALFPNPGPPTITNGVLSLSLLLPHICSTRVNNC